MKKTLIKTFSLLFLGMFLFTQAQFRNRDRQDRRQEQDSYQYSYGFYLNLNQFDYKLVLDPKYGMEDKVNLVQTKPTYSFGAGLIGRMRLNDNFDLRIEPGLQFVERELTFNTQSNDQYAADANNPQKTADANSNVQLIKLGNEIHGPEDNMIIARDQVLFFENLKNDGKVSATIKDYVDKNKK